MDDYYQLLNKINEKGLVPNPKAVGEFQKPQQDSDPLKFLNPNNWVFHEQIVDSVLKGEYEKIKPVTAEFITTLNCTNRCGICAYELPKRLEGCWQENLFSDPDCHLEDVDLGKKYLDKLFNYGLKGIIFTGGGEPFLFQGLEKLVQHTTDNNADSVIYTNGNTVTQERADAILTAEPLLIRTSLNAGTQEVYDQFHNPLRKKALQRTLNAIKYFSKAGPKTSIGVGIVINEINQDDLPETARRLREITDEGGKIDFVVYRPEFNYYGTKQLSPEFLDKTFEIVETNVKKTLKGTGTNVVNVKVRYDALKDQERTYQECRGAGLFMEVSPSGVYFCCDRNLNRKYLIGDLKSQETKEIISDLKRGQIQNFVNSHQCSVCPPACKSHEINKQFQQIEDLRSQGQIMRVKTWIDEQRKMPKPKMVNFP